MPIFLSVRMMRQAISPLFAISTFLNIFYSQRIASRLACYKPFKGRPLTADELHKVKHPKLIVE